MRKVEKLGVLHVRYLPEALREQIEKINLHRKATWISAAAVPVSIIGTSGYLLADKPAFAIPMAAYGAVAAAIGIWSARRKVTLTKEVAPQLARNEQARSLMAKNPTHIRVKNKVIEFFRAPRLKGKMFQLQAPAPAKPNFPKPSSRLQQREPPKPQTTLPIKPRPPRRSRK